MLKDVPKVELSHTPRENVSSGISDQVRLKPPWSTVEAS